MAIIALPPSVRIRHIEWSLDRPAQINRSPYSGARKVVANPWHGRWTARVELAPIIGEANVRAWRGFLASLKGQINTFLVPAIEGPQHALGTVFPAISNVSGTTVTAIGGSLYTIEKTGGVTATYDAAAVSASGFSGNFSLQMRQTVGNSGPFIGVSANPTAANGAIIDRSWQLFSTGTLWRMFESGTLQGGSLAASAYAFIWRTGSTVGYGRGATLAAAQAAPDRTVTDTSSLFLDCSLPNTSDKIEVLFSGTQNLPTASAGAAQGATSIALSGAPAMTQGMLATVSLPSGNKQLVMLTADLAGSTITFEPPLREAISTGAQVDTMSPGAQVALADSAFSWSVDQGQLYGISFGVEEAF